ncbi:MAG: hypothetical protein IID32_05790 [Planctomycetes bacterium]|nr:hypothetical protein [Planctomycetota bacterium]
MTDEQKKRILKLFERTGRPPYLSKRFHSNNIDTDLEKAYFAKEEAYFIRWLEDKLIEAGCKIEYRKGGCVVFGKPKVYFAAPITIDALLDAAEGVLVK